MFAPVISITPGSYFKVLGVTYRMVRVAGECQQPNRNQWGRSTGGYHTADKIAIQVWRYHKGWSPVHYTAFHKGTNGMLCDEPVWEGFKVG